MRIMGNRTLGSKRIKILPSLLTLGNFFCGFLAIVFCLNSLILSNNVNIKPDSTIAQLGDSRLSLDLKENTASVVVAEASNFTLKSEYMLWLACIIVLGGMIFDMLDGRVARMTGSASHFGAELDSLADVVTFGLAPAVIVITQWLRVMPDYKSWWGQVMIFSAVYAACAVLRLARYNVEIGGDKNIFHGLPSPAAAGCVVTSVLVFKGDYLLVKQFWIWLSGFFSTNNVFLEVEARFLSFYLLFVGCLMVSRVPFLHLANRYLGGRKPFTNLVLIIFILAVLFFEPILTLFFAFNGYLFFSLLSALYKSVRNKQKS